MRQPFVRNPLPRAVMIRLETGRIIVLSVLLGILVGGLSIILRKLLEFLLPLGPLFTGFSPPGTPGEGGLLVYFGEISMWALLSLPIIGALYAWLVPALPGNALAQLVRGYNTREPWPNLWLQLKTLIGTILAYSSGLLVGRDSVYTMMGQVGTSVLGRTTKLDGLETRTLMLAGAAAGLGTMLHAPLAAAVLVAEVLYRRFEFEFEMLMPSVLAAIVAYAVYGTAFGFERLFDVNNVNLPSMGQLPALILVAACVTFAAWALLWACRRIPDRLTDGRLRPILGGIFGLITAALAIWVTPGVLSDGAGWVQLGVGGFLDPRSAGIDGVGTSATVMGALRWVLLAIGARLAFGGGILPSVGTGGLLGVGIGQLMGLDPVIAGLTGAVSFLTVTLNVPVGAALLAIAWGGEGILPVALIAAAVAQFTSGETGIVPAQLRSRADSHLHNSGNTPSIPQTVRFVSPLGPALPPAPYDQKAAQAYTQAQSSDPSDPNERELYRLPLPTSWQNTRLEMLRLPSGIEVIGVMRQGEVRNAHPKLRLTAEDDLVMLARPEDYKLLEGMLRLPKTS